MNIDFSGSIKRVLFHFPKTKAVYDEWIEIESPRIAPFHTKQDADKSKRPAKKSGKKTAPTVVKTDEPPNGAVAKPNLIDHVEQNGSEKRAVSNDAPLQAPLLQGLSWPAASSALGGKSEAKPSPIMAGSRPAYVANSTVHSDGRVSMQLASSHQRSPVRPLVAQRWQTSPVKTPGENDSRHVQENGSQQTSSATYTIPRKSTVQDGADSLAARIPRKVVPSDSVGLTNGASLLLGMTSASAMSRNALNTNYFPQNLPDLWYQARAMEEQRHFPLPGQYFDARNYWQGQRQFPHQSDESQSKKQHDARR